MNQVLLVGRLTADPTVSTGASGVTVCRFSVAVDRFGGGEKRADFLDCVAFGKTAEFVGKWFSRGQWIGLWGRIQVESYTGRQGNKRRSWNVVLNGAEFVGARAPAEGAPTVAVPAQAQVQPGGFGSGGDEFAVISDEEDLPF